MQIGRFVVFYFVEEYVYILVNEIDIDNEENNLLNYILYQFIIYKS